MELPDSWEDSNDAEEMSGLLWGFKGEKIDEDAKVPTSNNKCQVDEPQPRIPIPPTWKGAQCQVSYYFKKRLQWVLQSYQDLEKAKKLMRMPKYLPQTTNARWMSLNHAFPYRQHEKGHNAKWVIILRKGCNEYCSPTKIWKQPFICVLCRLNLAKLFLSV